MSRIELKHIDKFYGSNHVLRDINLTIEDGDFMTLLGPSGCGKTTTLRVVSGLEKPQNGIMTIDGVEMINADDAYYAEPSKRGLNLVFQSYALWPHMTVYNNIAFGLKIQKMDKAEIDRRVRTAMRRVALDYDKLAQRSVFELSGGQMRRVAIAGVLAMEPQTLVLDEPCAGLDPRGREEILGLISDLHRESGATIVMVSHSMDDVAALAERVIVMNHGKVAMDGTPREIFSRGEELRAIGLDVPQAVELAQKLREKGFDVPEGIYKIEEVRAAVEAIVGKGGRHA